MFITTTGVITAVLTRYGKKIMDDDSASFNITQYAFSDDEIDYSLFDGTSIEAANPGLTYFPILEAPNVTNSGSGPADVSWPAQRYRLRTLNQGTLQVARVISTAHGSQWYPDGKQDEFPNFDRVTIWLDYDQAKASGEVFYPIRTLYGYDNSYIIDSTNLSIIAPTDPEPKSYSCPDLYAVRQNQSQADGTWNVRLNLSTGGMWPEASNVNWFHIIKNYVSGFEYTNPFTTNPLFARLTIPVLTDDQVSLLARQVPTYIDQLIVQDPTKNRFEEVGVAKVTYTHTGRNTGKKFYFDFEIYRPWRLAVYVNGFLNGTITTPEPKEPDNPKEPQPRDTDRPPRKGT